MTGPLYLGPVRDSAHAGQLQARFEGAWPGLSYSARRVTDAVERIADEIGDPDFDGWAEFVAAPDVVLAEIISEHAYAVWTEDCVSPSCDDLSDVESEWRRLYPAQATACEEAGYDRLNAAVERRAA